MRNLMMAVAAGTLFATAVNAGGPAYVPISKSWEIQKAIDNAITEARQLGAKSVIHLDDGSDISIWRDKGSDVVKIQIARAGDGATGGVTGGGGRVAQNSNPPGGGMGNWGGALGDSSNNIGAYSNSGRYGTNGNPGDDPNPGDGPPSDPCGC